MHQKEKNMLVINIILIFSLKLDLNLISAKRYDQEIPDSANGNINFIKKIVTSKPITLLCAKPGRNSTGAEVVWYFQSCFDPCDVNNMKTSNKKICNAPSQPSCSAKMTIERPLSGLYKCYKIEKKIGYVSSATPIVTYNIQVLERSLEPEFTEIPENQETYEGNDVIFSCKIKSSLPLHVKWYKRVQKIPGAFQYESNYYQVLNSTDVVKFKDVFASKLEIKETTKGDSGIYTCSGVNEAGIRFKEANLTVIENKEKFNDGPLRTHWKLILISSAILFLVVALKCVILMHLVGGSSTKKEAKAKRRRRLRQVQDNTDLETSDYEHVVSFST